MDANWEELDKMLKQLEAMESPKSATPAAINQMQSKVPYPQTPNFSSHTTETPPILNHQHEITSKWFPPSYYPPPPPPVLHDSKQQPLFLEDQSLPSQLHLHHASIDSLIDLIPPPSIDMRLPRAISIEDNFLPYDHSDEAPAPPPRNHSIVHLLQEQTPLPPPRIVRIINDREKDSDRAIYDPQSQDDVEDVQHAPLRMDSLHRADFVEVDYGEFDVKEKLEECKRQKALARMSQLIQFENVTEAEYSSLYPRLKVANFGIKNAANDIALPPSMNTLREGAESDSIPELPIRRRLQISSTPTSYDVPPQTDAQLHHEPQKHVVHHIKAHPKKPHAERRQGGDNDDRSTILSKESHQSKSSVSDQQKTADDTTYLEKSPTKSSRPKESSHSQPAISRHADVKKISIKIYVGSARSFKVLKLTSLMTAIHVIDLMRENGAIDNDNEWTLFEFANDVGVERPIRDYEVVTDVISTWEKETVNALLIKKYGYRDSLSIQESRLTYPKMCGWLFHEVKQGKWQKKYFELKSSGLYHSRDTKSVEETLVCSLATFDVYTLMRTRKRAPSKFCFALKSQERNRHFENENDFVFFLCADNLDKMKDWILNIRHEKGRKIIMNRDSTRKLDIHDVESLSVKEIIRKNKKSRRSPIATPSGPPPHSTVEMDTERNSRPAKSATSPIISYSSQSKLAHAEKVSLIEQIGRREETIVYSNSDLPMPERSLVHFTKRELQGIPGVDASKLKIKPPSVSKLQLLQKSCGICDCGDFARNPFRERSCANCFHIH